MARTWEATDTTRNGKYGIFEHGPGGGVVATVHTSISPAAGHDNARLIAAAPDMLDVLKLVAENEQCACQCKTCGYPNGYHPNTTPIDVHEYTPPAPCLGCQVDAAIALAEGQAQ